MSRNGLSSLTHRKYRRECESEIYHVTTRGITRQAIFEDDSDRVFLLDIMKRFLESTDAEVEIFAWCFMSNHIHLLIHGHLSNVSSYLCRVLSRYAKYFNKRHHRTGHLFEERFDSSPIDTTEYLMTAVRYIHHNPISAGWSDYRSYPWSSYREYVEASGISEIGFVLAAFDGIDGFIDFHQYPNDDQVTLASRFESFRQNDQSGDDKAIEVAKALLELEDLSEIGASSKEQRNRMLATLKTRLTIAQIMRITGIGRNIIQRAK